MSDMSEDRHCAAWTEDLEYELWVAVHEDKNTTWDDDELDKLRILSAETRTWGTYDGPISLELWRENISYGGGLEKITRYRKYAAEQGKRKKVYR